jgi:alkyl sulfatase BDS1-like metallo-beta-lactamase superfamily hydrolase
LSVNTEAKDATIATRAVNALFEKMLPFTDTQDFEDAKRGFMAELPNGQIIWDPSKYSFVKDSTKASATANPSLWRQSQLLAQGGS